MPSDRDVLDKCSLDKPTVPFWTYWPEIVSFALAVAAPIAAWLIWCDGEMLERAGSVMMFFAVLPEFVTLNRMNRRNLANLCRNQAGDNAWDYKTSTRVVGWVTFVLALVATFIMGYAGYLL